MLLAYIDESCRNEADVYVLSAVVCDGPSLSVLEPELRNVVEAASCHGVSRWAELHAYEIFHGAGEWAPLKKKVRARVDVYAKSFQAIETSKAEVFVQWTKPSKLFHDPHDICLRYLLERLDTFAESQDDYVVVIADHVDQSNYYKASLRQYQRYGTGGYKDKTLDRTLDTLHFGDSRESMGLQAADLVAFLYGRTRIPAAKRDPKEVSATNSIWDRLTAPKVSWWYPQR